ncbi:AAA family ATPase [Rhizobium halophytocola]|uniref:Aminoglycoside phosphotransferase family enzyme/predicted kinase n=1 Tax=Rhizobium halophytocola TaxID=735519 RepID=A0ABS4E257_9HYPH|nr:bifunctional aminoglycoside phosphotransferase/ATP-binding protein [Rhizobium halophytocola]MBP1852023.1 aminoglycoside phosphotransferase family enzyme/predicted kinase [Rhizobium halophytocola]
MIDQRHAIAFLSDAASYGAAGAVEIIETHISMIFLVGDRAFKLKRAVSLPYLDFSTFDLRRQTCEKEVALNGRVAPDLYLGTRLITRAADGRLAFDGEGEAVEIVVEMLRFDQQDLFDRMAEDGRLTTGLMSETAAMIAGFHETAQIDTSGRGVDNIAAVLDINEAGFATSGVFSADAVSRLMSRARRVIADQAACFDRRAAEGRIRRCHGDLHLRNIVRHHGRPQLFDCIEFSDAIATCDVLYDLAYLLMDLWHRDLPHFASLVVNRYLDETEDEDGFHLLAFFMAVRAQVRAHVIATQAQEGGDADETLARTARRYFGLAEALLAPAPERLVVLGGFSGSGKSTVAERLAPQLKPAPGARLLETDRLRKAMFGMAMAERLPLEAYRPEVSDRIYEQLRERSVAIVKAGGCVIASAVFDRPEQRQAIEDAARMAGLSMQGFWLEVDPEVLRQRVAGRDPGPSDATVAVLQDQMQHDIGMIDWHRIDAGQPVEAVAADIHAALSTTDAEQLSAD